MGNGGISRGIPILLGLGVAATTFGCGGQEEEEPREGFVGPKGLEGIEGELEGQEVWIPASGQTGGAGSHDSYHFYPFIPDGWAYFKVPQWVWYETVYSVDLDLGIVLMPPGQPLAGHYVCSGEGAVLSQDEDRIKEVQFKSPTDMGSCEEAGAGTGTITLRYAHEGQRTNEWEVSEGLFLDGVTHDDIEQETTTENGPVFLQVMEGEVEEIGTPHEIEGGAVFTYNPDGELLLLCVGEGSTVTYHEEETTNGTEYWTEYNFVGVSIAGACPGDPLEGSMTLINGQSNRD